MFLVAAASGQPEILPSVTLLLQRSSAAEALQALCEQVQLGLITSELPPEPAEVNLEEVPLEEALASLAETFVLDCARYRNLIVATPGAPGLSLRERFRRILAPEVAELLLRPPDDGRSPEVPGYDTVLEAIRVLYRGTTDALSREKLARAAYWMAAPELASLLRYVDSMEEGKAFIRAIAREPTEEDPCTEHLCLVWPCLDFVPPSLLVGVEPLASKVAVFHAPDYDKFALSLQRERGLISVEEYTRRIIQRSQEKEDPFAGEEPLQREIGLRAEGNLRDLAEGLAEQLGVPVQVRERVREVRATVRAEGVRAREVLLALSRVTGTVLQASDNGPGYVLDTPLVPLEQLLTALPLRVWVAVQSTTFERDWQRQQAVRRFWSALDQGQVNRLRGTVTRSKDYQGRARRALQELATLVFAPRFKRWLENLPLRKGPVPLWLYENKEGGGFELAAPGGGEYVEGLNYLWLKTQLRGKPFVKGKTAPLKKGDQEDQE